MIDRIADEITREMLKGDTLIRLGRTDEAFAALDKLVNNYPDTPNVLYEVGERYRRLAERRHHPADYMNYFETAIQLFERSQKLFDNLLQPPPCHPVYSRAFLYDNMGYYEKTIEMWEEIIKRLNRDYQGKGVEWPHEMLEAMKKKITQQKQA